MDKTFCTLNKKRADRRISGVRFVTRSGGADHRALDIRDVPFSIPVSSSFLPSFPFDLLGFREEADKPKSYAGKRAAEDGGKKAKESERKRKKGEERLHKRMSSIGLSRRDAFPIASPATRRRENLDSRLPYPSLASKLVLKRLKDRCFYPRGRHFPLIYTYEIVSTLSSIECYHALVVVFSVMSVLTMP